MRNFNKCTSVYKPTINDDVMHIIKPNYLTNKIYLPHDNTTPTQSRLIVFFFFYFSEGSYNGGGGGSGNGGSGSGGNGNGYHY